MGRYTFAVYAGLALYLVIIPAVIGMLVMVAQR
jgi:hypothetical protein